ncbi:lipocalin family protein [Phenylobacterium sp.]|uniref:lipocalin family protein n=1 Tax=Phenylobacterium sp. TaxID=1871053 RepID=UPI003523DB43
MRSRTMQITRMFPAAIAASALALSACAAGPVGNTRVPEPAKAVEFERYQGLWYEFARYDNRFERGCEGVTARYAKLPDGLISVLNTCRKGAPDGPAKSSDGRAKPVGDAKAAKLKVSFFGPFFFGDYWVLDRSDDYSWAIVGEPSGRYLWVLTREAQPSAERRRDLLARVKGLGYDLGLLRMTRHAGGTP